MDAAGSRCSMEAGLWGTPGLGGQQVKTAPQRFTWTEGKRIRCPWGLSRIRGCHPDPGRWPAGVTSERVTLDDPGA